MHEKLVSIGDDYWIENDQGQLVFKVDGEAMRIRDTFQIEDPQGLELAKSPGSSRVWQWRPRTDSSPQQQRSVLDYYLEVG